jgi:hypothetical protein
MFAIDMHSHCGVPPLESQIFSLLSSNTLVASPLSVCEDQSTKLAPTEELAQFIWTVAN